MSAAQFKRRTSELALPKESHDKYEEIRGTGDQCSVSRPAPARAHVSGLRAGNFGDLIVADHAEVEFRKHKFAVSLILDAATSSLTAY